MVKNKKKNVQMGLASKLMIGVFVSLAATGLTYVCTKSKNNTLTREVDDLRVSYSRAESEYIHEENIWKAMSENPEILNRAILEKGLMMGFPEADQIVRIDATGKPLPGQPSLARYKKIASERLVVTH